MPVLLDGGSWKPGLEELLAETELAVLSSAFTVPGGAGSAGVLEAVLAAGPSWAAVSDGAGPVRWRWAGGLHGEVPVPSSTSSTPSAPVTSCTARCSPSSAAGERTTCPPPWPARWGRVALGGHPGALGWARQR